MIVEQESVVLNVWLANRQKVEQALVAIAEFYGSAQPSEEVSVLIAALDEAAMNRQLGSHGLCSEELPGFWQFQQQHLLAPWVGDFTGLHVVPGGGYRFNTSNGDSNALVQSLTERVGCVPYLDSTSVRTQLLPTQRVRQRIQMLDLNAAFQALQLLFAPLKLYVADLYRGPRDVSSIEAFTQLACNFWNDRRGSFLQLSGNDGQNHVSVALHLEHWTILTQHGTKQLLCQREQLDGTACELRLRFDCRIADTVFERIDSPASQRLLKITEWLGDALQYFNTQTPLLLP
ncbi:MAG TPA: hypothetical protein VLG40_02100 [Candidatus Saccharimonas sp.]|nr:hypothetical protein [Candidatus Saccharimonas sp.]